jgi:hypothetical protein
LLLGLIRETEGIAFKVLGYMGAEPALVRGEVLNLLGLGKKEDTVTTPDTFEHWVEFTGSYGERVIIRPGDISAIHEVPKESFDRSRSEGPMCCVYTNADDFLILSTINDAMQKIHEALEGAVNEAAEAIMALRGKS